MAEYLVTLLHQGFVGEESLTIETNSDYTSEDVKEILSSFIKIIPNTLLRSNQIAGNTIVKEVAKKR